jgi:hypothetical protein
VPGRYFECRTYSVVGLNEGVVDSDDVDIVVLNAVKLSAHGHHYEAPNEVYSRVAEDNATNAAETVDTDLLRASVAAKSW